MKAINGLSNSAKSLVIIGALLIFFIIVPFGMIGNLAFTGLAYYVPTSFAIIALSVSAILSLHQKRISINSVAVFISGLLFLASSLIEFGFHIFAQNMSIHDHMQFSGIIRPNQISHGLSAIGAGIVFILLAKVRNVQTRSSTAESFKTQDRSMSGIFLICLGIFFLLFGMYILVNGLQPL